MVPLSFFLKLKTFFKKEGATLTEILISVAVLAILAVMVLFAFRPSTQLAKGRDARRKSDISKLKNILEDYYNDHNCYPTESLDVLVTEEYLDRVPTDPSPGRSYQYVGDCSSYYIYTRLEYERDPNIAAAGCQFGCGPGGDTGSCEYNYGVCSSDTRLEGCTEATCSWYGCSDGRCNSVAEDWPGEPKYCDDPCCGGACCGPSGCPWVCE